MSGTRVGSGTCASSAWRTIGASTPSMSRSTPLRAGSARSGAIASDSVADTDTGEVSRMRRPTPRRSAAFAAAPGARSDGRPRGADYHAAHGGAPNARAGGDRHRGRAVQRAVRGRRRGRHRADARHAHALRRSRGDGHVARRHRGHGGRRDARPRRLRQSPRRRRPARRRAGRRRRRRRDVAAAARPPARRPPRLRRRPRRRRARPRAQVIWAAVNGVMAGVLAGLLGVGGGVLFVPALTVFLGLDQVDAEATSLLAIMPMALVGAWRQTRYGNMRVRDAAVLGPLAIPGAVAGVAIVNVVPERAVQVAFAGLMLVIAFRLVRGTPREEEA